jgi:hypothetical protein
MNEEYLMKGKEGPYSCDGDYNIGRVFLDDNVVLTLVRPIQNMLDIANVITAIANAAHENGKLSVTKNKKFNNRVAEKQNKNPGWK